MFEGVDDVFLAFLFVSFFRRRAWLPGFVCKQEVPQGTRRPLPLLRFASLMESLFHHAANHAVALPS